MAHFAVDVAIVGTVDSAAVRDRRHQHEAVVIDHGIGVIGNRVWILIAVQIRRGRVQKNLLHGPAVRLIDQASGHGVLQHSTTAMSEEVDIPSLRRVAQKVVDLAGQLGDRFLVAGVSVPIHEPSHRV